MLRVLDDDAVQRWCTERQLQVTDAFFPTFEPKVHSALCVEYPHSPCRHSTLISDIVRFSDDGNLHERFDGGLWVLLQPGMWDDFGDPAIRSFLLQTCGFDPDKEDFRAIEFDAVSETEAFHVALSGNKLPLGFRFYSSSRNGLYCKLARSVFVHRCTRCFDTNQCGWRSSPVVSNSQRNIHGTQGPWLLKSLP